jgi:Ricin-type beta-trefoil lectin domain
MSVLNFQVVKNLVNITLSIALVASLTPSLFANAQVTAGTTQLNQINFEPAISLSEVREYLKNNQFKNLKSASIVADLETKDFVLPVNLDLNLEDDNNDSKTITSYQSTKKAIIDGIRQAKKDINKPKQKFDSKKLLESFQVSSSSTLPAGAKLADEVANLPKPPAPKPPTEEELKYYEDNGVLPPIKVDPEQIKKLIKDSGLPENYPVPHLDPIQKGKFSNSRPEDVYNSMTPAERQANQKRMEETKLQEELVTKTTEEELKNIELDNTTNKTPELKISQLNYYTEVGDSNAKDTAIKAQKPNSKEAKEENKPKLQRNDEARKTKQNSQEQKTKKNSKKIEDKVKDTVSQDITSLFKVSDEQTNKVKSETEKQKKDWINGTKTNKQQLNEYEAEGYVKEGLDLTTLNVDVIDATTNKLKTKSQVQDMVNREKKTSSLGDLLSFGSVKAEAKGLNNAKFSLLIYNNQDNGQSFNAPSNANWTQLKLFYTNGYTGQQRWCFDNDSNQIYLSNTSDCQGKWGQKCIHALDGASYGSRVGLYDCSWNNYNDAWQKWVFDENGRISLLYRQDFCIEKSWGLSYSQLDKGLVMWGCNSGAGKENQEYRAGYNNFGQNMGMTIWANRNSFNVAGLTCIGPCSNGYNAIGHAYTEFWNALGTHNTFSRWDYTDTNDWRDGCSNYNGNSVNNICDRDNITVDAEIDMKTVPKLPKYSQFKARNVGLIKSYWDYISFGSGYRSNFVYWGTNVDLGGLGTYYSNNTSASRDSNYNAYYGVFSGGVLLNTSYVCSGQAVKLWNTAYGYDNISTGWWTGQPAMSPNAIYYQL